MAQLIFNPLTGVEVPEAIDVVNDLGKKIQDAFHKPNDEVRLNIDPTSPMGQLIEAFAAEVIAKNSELAHLVNQMNLNSSEGRYLDNLVTLFLISRKLSEPTIVECICSGLKGTVIPYGAIVENTNGNALRHNVSGGVIIGDTGTVKTTFSTVEHGAIEVAANTVTKIVTIIPGWDTINNETPGVVGRDRETDAELRARYRKSVAINSIGSVDAIESNLANIDGVIDVKVLENYGNSPIAQYGVTVPAHGIAVCIFGGEDEEIAETIYRIKMGGTAMAGNTTVSFIDPVYLNAKYEYPIYRPQVENFKVKVDVYASSLSESVQEDIKQKIVNDALGQLDHERIGLAQTIYADRFRSAVYAVTSIPVKQIQIALGTGGSWADRLSINANIEPSIAIENVEIVLSEP